MKLLDVSLGAFFVHKTLIFYIWAEIFGDMILHKFLMVVLLVAGSLLYAQEDSSRVFRVDSIAYHIGDAFDDAKAHTSAERSVYNFLNWIHIETTEGTVQKLLLFDKGDLVNLNLVLESERFLRDQNFLSDASIAIENVDGKNVAQVYTSDNWTLSVPLSVGFSGSEFTYDNLNYGIGIQESNFLGLGQNLGFYFGHDEFRDMLSLQYANPHFLFRYNRLDASYSYNTDGYLAYWKMYVPFLSRSMNQWAYTLVGYKNKKISYIYGSGDLPAGAVLTETKLPLDSLQEYNGKKATKLLKIKDFVDDSLTFAFSRSFGGTLRKFYVGATYDYLNQTAEDGTVFRNLFYQDSIVYSLDSNALDKWLPERTDSRVGFYLMYSNIRYEKIKNFHNVKWTEDVDKGWSLKAKVSKNYEQLGAADNDIRFDFWTNLYLGRNYHHLTLKSEMAFYLDHGESHDTYKKISGEYIFHPSSFTSTALTGWVDMYQDARYGYQLTLGGANGFLGFPTGIYAGQARVFANLEQRFFPNFELGTLMPVFAIFGSIGETAGTFEDLNREDLIYVAGVGVRFAQTKSISRLINKVDVSFPINGVRKGEPHFSVTTTYSL